MYFNAIKFTLITCVSNMTFLVMSKVLPDPNKPLCPGLSTRISDAITIGTPSASRNRADCSALQTLYTAGILYYFKMSDSSRCFRFGIFNAWNRRRTFDDSIPAAMIVDAKKRWNAAILDTHGPVVHSK